MVLRMNTGWLSGWKLDGSQDGHWMVLRMDTGWFSGWILDGSKDEYWMVSTGILDRSQDGYWMVLRICQLSQEKMKSRSLVCNTEQQRS